MFVIYQLDKARNLRFNMKALALIEKKLNMKIAKLNEESVGINEIAVILWAGLQHEDNTLTPEKVMDLIDEHSSIDEASEKIAEGFNVFFSKKN
jgi:hypothetical protein